MGKTSIGCSKDKKKIYSNIFDLQEICIGSLRYKRTAKCDQYNLFYKDFKYYKVKASHGRTQWLCTKNTSFRCRARVVTSDLPQNGVGQPGKWVSPNWFSQQAAILFYRLLYFTGQHTHDPAEGSIRSRATQQEVPPERTPKWILNAAETPPEEEDDDDEDDEDVRINDDGVRVCSVLIWPAIRTAQQLRGLSRLLQSFWIGDLFYRRSRTGNGYTLVYEGHKYCRGSQAGKHTYWQCTRRTAPETLGCKGRLTTRNIARFGFRAPGRWVALTFTFPSAWPSCFKVSSNVKSPQPSAHYGRHRGTASRIQPITTKTPATPGSTKDLSNCDVTSITSN